MAELIAERVSRRMSDLGVTQVKIARATGLSQPTIGRFISGEVRKTTKLVELAQALQTTPEYLTGQSEDPDVPGSSEHRATFGAFPVQRLQDVAEEAGLVPVRQIDLAYGMGATFLDMVVDEVTQFFPVDWLRQFTKAPASKLFFAQGVGDSMQPTLAPNDTLIIDTSVDRLTMSDQIWAITYCGLGMIKRLRPSKDGGIRIMSDNLLVPEEVAYDGEVNLVGRVVAVMRKV